MAEVDQHGHHWFIARSAFQEGTSALEGWKKVTKPCPTKPQKSDHTVVTVWAYVVDSTMEAAGIQPAARLYASNLTETLNGRAERSSWTAGRGLMLAARRFEIRKVACIPSGDSLPHFYHVKDASESE